MMCRRNGLYASLNSHGKKEIACDHPQSGSCGGYDGYYARICGRHACRHHCYSYSVEMAKEYVKMGYYIGIGGVVTFKNAKKLKNVVESIPLTSIVLETDCPYLAPEPYRGKRNSSLYLPYVAEKIAELKGVSAEEVIRQTEENSRKLYGL